MVSQITRKPVVKTTDESGMRAVREGENYVMMPILGRPGVWLVGKPGQELYRVDTAQATCSCPDHEFRVKAGKVDRCKHQAMLSLKLQLLQSRPAPAPVNRDAQMIRDFGPDCF